MSPFEATVTKDQRVLVAWGGRTVVTVAGARGRRLAEELACADDDEAARQLLLARATGNFKRGNER
jgi:hypothetical protein